MLGLAVAEKDADPNLKDPLPKLTLFRQRHHITYPLLSDEDQTVFDRFGGGQIPTCVIVDRQGNYVATYVGDLAAVKRQIDRILAL